MFRYLLACAAVVCGLSVNASAVIAVPTPRIFASQWGTVALKVIPAKNDMKQSRAVLFTLDEDGSEKVVWDKQLVNLPGQVLVYDMGGKRFVVTLDGWGNMGGPNAVVIYGAEGDMVAALDSTTIAGPQPEPRGRIILNGGGRPWQKGAKFAGTPQNPTVQITLTDDRTVEIDLASGKVMSAK